MHSIMRMIMTNVWICLTYGCEDGLHHNGQIVNRAEGLYPDESRHGDDLIK